MNLEHKHLAKTTLFWLALLIPILLGLVLATLIFFSEPKMSGCFKSECIQHFFMLYKFPFVIAGLSLPLIAMVAAIHRSIETSLQISHSAKQFKEAVTTNRFGNYLKHREGFEKLIDGYCSRRHYKNNCKTFVLTHGLYGRLFPDASFENIEWNGQHNKERLSLMEKHAKIIIEEYKKPASEFNCYRFLSAVKVLTGTLSLNYSPQRKLAILKNGIDDKKQIICPGVSGHTSPILSVARDALSLFILVRSYVGLNDPSDFTVNWRIQGFSERLKNSPNAYTLEDLK